MERIEAPSVGGSPKLEPTPAQVWKYWVQCEEIAMHFNKLILDFRVRALGGVSVAVGVMIATLKTESVDRHLPYLGGWLVAMAVIWCAVALIDRYYYQRLLHGVVIEILRIEREYGGNFLRASRQIEHTVNDELGNNKSWPRWAFYGLPLFALVGGAAWCFAAWYQEPATKTAAEHAVNARVSAP